MSSQNLHNRICTPKLGGVLAIFVPKMMYAAITSKRDVFSTFGETGATPLDGGAYQESNSPIVGCHVIEAQYPVLEGLSAFRAPSLRHHVGVVPSPNRVAAELPALYREVRRGHFHATAR